ncbi:aldose epimerase family protein [Alteromonadaceae bacterium BrNp21-10]|nr:aldose epimerase family protein [Alteromonadaceae bacterium BrNp21-10]
MQNLPSTRQSHYGYLADGTEINRVTLQNSNGVEVEIISYGGIITRLLTADKNGKFNDIVLGLDNIDSYVKSNPYFGALIGRYGNRIAKGKFTLAGKNYQLDTNDGENHLHGGVQGFDKKVWDMAPFVTEHSAGVVMTLVSPDGDQGYPGTLTSEVVYELTNEDELDMRFSATTDKATIVNMTQHSYFNLAGKGSILDHQLMINSKQITPVDKGLIPTGEFSDITNGPFDFSQLKAIGKDINANDQQMKFGLGYDHNYVLFDKEAGAMSLAARVVEPTSGRILEVHTEEPAVQFYSGNFLDGTLTGKGQTYQHRSGLCLEPQHHPDSPNHSHFPTTTLLPGDTYKTRISYRFLTTQQKLA